MLLERLKPSVPLAGFIAGASLLTAPDAVATARPALEQAVANIRPPAALENKQVAQVEVCDLLHSYLEPPTMPWFVSGAATSQAVGQLGSLDISGSAGLSRTYWRKLASHDQWQKPFDQHQLNAQYQLQVPYNASSGVLIYLTYSDKGQILWHSQRMIVTGSGTVYFDLPTEYVQHWSQDGYGFSVQVESSGPAESKVQVGQLTLSTLACVIEPSPEVGVMPSIDMQPQPLEASSTQQMEPGSTDSTQHALDQDNPEQINTPQLSWQDSELLSDADETAKRSSNRLMLIIAFGLSGLMVSAAALGGIGVFLYKKRQESTGRLVDGVLNNTTTEDDWRRLDSPWAVVLGGAVQKLEPLLLYRNLTSFQSGQPADRRAPAHILEANSDSLAFQLQVGDAALRAQYPYGSLSPRDMVERALYHQTLIEWRSLMVRQFVQMIQSAIRQRAGLLTRELAELIEYISTVQWSTYPVDQERVQSDTDEKYNYRDLHRVAVMAQSIRKQIQQDPSDGAVAKVLREQVWPLFRQLLDQRLLFHAYLLLLLPEWPESFGQVGKRQAFEMYRKVMKTYDN